MMMVVMSGDPWLRPTQSRKVGEAGRMRGACDADALTIAERDGGDGCQILRSS